MGCNNSKARLDALENRFQAMEERLNVTPNELTHAKVVQVLEEKYGQASQELVRLQKIMELMNQAETLITASKNRVEEAGKMENISIRMVEPGVRVQVTQLGLVLLYGSRGDSIYYSRDGKSFEVDNSCEYDNYSTTCIHLALPGEVFTYKRGSGNYRENSASYRCYFIVLK